MYICIFQVTVLSFRIILTVHSHRRGRESKQGLTYILSPCISTRTGLTKEVFTLQDVPSSSL